MRCILVLGGPRDEWLPEPPEQRDGDLVVACDGGYPAAVECGLHPALAVGDFDSYRGDIAPGVQVITAPPMKDETDAAMGARIALERGCDDFLIVGALGGRLDHTLANLQTMAWLRDRGARAEIRSLRNRVWIVENESLTLPRMKGWHLSVFAWGGPCGGVTLRGVAYPLTDHLLTPVFPVGVSNEFAEDTARITAGDGTLLVVASKETSCAF